MPKPTPTEQQLRLNELFTGTWRGEETLHPTSWDPKGGTATGAWVCRTALDGFTVIADYEETRDGKVVYRGHGIHGWDPQAKQFLTYWFDSIGVMPPAPNKATLDGTTYSYLSVGDVDAVKNTQRMTYAWPDATTFTFKIESSLDGGATWKPVHDGTYTRQ